MTEKKDSEVPGPRRRRSQIIREALGETLRMAQSQTDVLELEHHRQAAELQLEQANQNLQNGIHGLSDQFQRMGVSISDLQNLMPAPPSSPSKSQAKLERSNTPTGAPPAQSVPTTPSKRPPIGTTLRSPVKKGTAKPDPVQPGSNYPAYVVYAGFNNFHGLFYAWRTYKDMEGAVNYVDVMDHNHVVKGFDTVKSAQKAYNSFIQSNIPELLAQEPPTDDERFIVVEGAKPMACRNRKTLIMEGVYYHGGVAYRFLGDMPDARKQFNDFKRAGIIRRLNVSLE